MVYTGAGNVPYVQFESVGDFIPKPRCSKFAVGLQSRRREMGGTRGPVGLCSEGPKATGAPLCAKCLSVCSRFEPSGSPVVCVVQVVVNRSLSLFRRERILFYR